MNTPIQSTLPPAVKPAKSPRLPEETNDPFQMVVDANHGTYCRSIETEARERILREEEQARLQAFMRAANAD